MPVAPPNPRNQTTVRGEHEHRDHHPPGIETPL
jgi:hypothetical protein